jgi:hypothetical protein
MSITKHTITEQRDSLSKFFPSIRPLCAKDIPEKNFYKLLLGYAKEFVRMECAMIEAQQQQNPKNTTVFIEEWEKSLGIPDDCFSVTGTLAERRLNVVVKFALMNIQTKPDFIALAAIYGFDIEIVNFNPGTGFPFTFPFILVSGDSFEENFVVIIRFLNVPPPPPVAVFPYTFPITFGVSEINIVQCLFEKLKPVDVELRFEFAAP